jgi:WD40 repeat protein
MNEFNNIDVLKLIFYHFTKYTRNSLIGRLNNSTLLTSITIKSSLPISRSINIYLSTRSLLYLPNGNIVTGSTCGTILILDSQNEYRCLYTLYVKGSVRSLLLVDNGDIASCSTDRIIKVWESKINYGNHYNLRGHENYVNCLLRVSDCTIASGSDDRTIRIWDCLNGYKCINVLKHLQNVTSMTLLPGKVFASSSYDRIIKLWDTTNYKCLKNIELAVLLLLTVSDDIIATAKGNHITLYNSSWKSIFELTGHKGPVTCMAVVYGDLASASKDGTIRLWNGKNNFRCFLVLRDHSQEVYCLMLIPDYKLVSGSKDYAIIVRDYS